MFHVPLTNNKEVTTMLERVRNAVIPQGHYLGGIVSQLLRYVIFIPPFTFLLHRLQTGGLLEMGTVVDSRDPGLSFVENFTIGKTRPGFFALDTTRTENILDCRITGGVARVANKRAEFLWFRIVMKGGATYLVVNAIDCVGIERGRFFFSKRRECKGSVMQNMRNQKGTRIIGEKCCKNFLNFWV